MGFVASRLGGKDVEALKTIFAASGETRQWVVNSPPYREQLKALRRELDLNRSKPSAPTVLDPYFFVGNGPTVSIDKVGLDRWHGDALHTWVIVENWNDNCTQVTGYTKIEFGPCYSCWGTYLTLFLWAPGEITITSVSKPTTGIIGWRIPSSCEADKFLLDWAFELQKDPDRYNFIGANCRHFSAYAQNVGIEETAP
jgi:hypothetical protein